MRLSASYDFLPRSPTVRASCVMDHFGIGLEQGRHVIAEDLELPVEPGDVALFTGPSGSGKSSLMRAAARELAGTSVGVLDVNSLAIGEELLIDALGVAPLDGMQLLAQCGLGEARLLLRRPAELSDGQLYRFRLALALSRATAWVVADEFTATLDRTLAKVIAFNLRRLADRMGVGLLLATTHEDVIEDLSPDVHVQCRLDGTVVVRSPASSNQTAASHVATPGEPRAKSGFLGDGALRSPASRDDAAGGHGDSACEPAEKPGFAAAQRKKKRASASSRNCGSATRPARTGRTSHGGITAAIRSP